MRIRQSVANGEALDRFLGTEDTYGPGVLTRQLLRHLWRHLNPQHHTLLLELMKAFNLLRPLADTETFLVPAMFPRQQLPDEYLTPHWWLPSKAAVVAMMRVQDVTRRAEMRIMYKVLGGRLSSGFMSELQVRLAQSDSVDQDKELHFVPEASVVERISGSVLSVAYTGGGGTVREWVVLSRAHDGKLKGGPINCLRIMGWAELSSSQGATDWRLFRRVLQEIEGMAKNAPGLNLRKIVFCINAFGKLAKPLEITRRNEARQVFLFEFEDGSKTDVCHDLVLPSLSETALSKPQTMSLQPAVLESTRHGVDAFFAKRVDDHKIDVHAEGQMMMREMLNPVNAVSRWDCNVNPQPTLGDLRCSIASCRQRNVRVLHLAGHGRRECDFIWNASDDAKQSQEFDVEAISLAIGMAAGAKGPLECAVLNACSTEKMGRLLRTHDVPCVICWKTPVQDETAKEMCELFYRTLVQDSSGARDYRRAFFATADALRLSAYTGSSKTKPHDVHDLGSSVSLRPSGTTRSMSPQEAGSSRGRVRTCHEEDVVLFLSKDGDSDPIYLWRERPLLAPPSLAPADANMMDVLTHADIGMKLVDAELQALFEQYGLGNLCAEVCKDLEVERVVDLALVKQQHLDDLPKYLVDKYSIRRARKEKLEQIIREACAQRACVPIQVALAPAPHGQSRVLGTTSMTQERLPCIEGFFCRKTPDKKELTRQIETLEMADGIDKDAQVRELKATLASIDSIDVHKEAQELKTSLTHGRQVYEVSIHAQPSFEVFSECMRSARERNVRILHFAGHGQSRYGFFWLKHGTATEYEEVQPDRFAGLIQTELAGPGVDGVECVVLNACETEQIGKKLRTVGVRHVVSWRSEVEDGTASRFALDFYKSLDQQNPLNAKNYKHAFHQAVVRMHPCEGATRAPQKHLAAGAIDYVCLLSQDGDACPNTGRIRDLNQGDDDSNGRKLCTPKGKEDWSALAGQQEVALLKALGFDTTLIHNGQGLDHRGMASTDMMRQLWGVDYYSQLWGSDGRSVLKAASASAAQRMQAVTSLAQALEYRKEDMKRCARNRRCRGMCPTASNCQDCRSRVTHEFMFLLLGESRDAILAI